MAHKLTTRDVLSIYGINSRTLDVWVAEGCPVAVKGAGRRQSRYDARKFAKWVTAHGKNPKGIEGATIKDAAKDNPPSAPKPERKTIDPPAQLDAVRGQYGALMNSFVRMANAGANDADIASISRILTAKGTELRLLEMDVLEWKTKTGALCDYAEMQRLFVDLASGVRERIMALPNELAPALREYLRDPDDAGKVRDEIDQAIRHALAALPDVLPEKTA